MQALESVAPVPEDEDRPVPAPRAPASPAPPDRAELREVVTAVLGLLALGATAAVGTGGANALEVTRISPSLVVGAVGALVLTGPALVVGHQTLRVDSPVSAVVDRLATGLAAGGRIAWGVVPTALFFAATAPGRWPLILAVLGSGVAGILLGRTALGLDGLAPRHPAWRVAVLAWVGVTLAIGLRLATTLLGG